MGLQLKISKKIYLKYDDKVIFKCHQPDQCQQYKSTIKMPGWFTGTCSLWVSAQSVVITRKVFGQTYICDHENISTNCYVDLKFGGNADKDLGQAPCIFGTFFFALFLLGCLLCLAPSQESPQILTKLIKGRSISSPNEMHKISLNNDDKCTLSIIDYHGKKRQKVLVDADCSSLRFTETNIYALNYKKTIIWSFISVFDEEPIKNEIRNDGSFCSYTENNKIKKCLFEKANKIIK